MEFISWSFQNLNGVLVLFVYTSRCEAAWQFSCQQPMNVIGKTDNLLYSAKTLGGCFIGKKRTNRSGEK